jgi:surface protein
MPTKSTYFLNAPSFLNATAVFTDASMATCAPDGFYSAEGVIREQVSCVLLPPVNCPDCEFISVWDTTLVSTGSSGVNQVKLPLVSTGTYNFRVFWGDGRSDVITSWNQAEVTHTYDTIGVYTITIVGQIVGWQFAFGGDLLKITEILQWGCFNHGDQINVFAGCSNLQIMNVTDTLELGTSTTLRGFFWDCSNLSTIDNINSWDTSTIKNFYLTFRGCTNFNDNINNWIVSNADTYTGLNQTEGLHGMFRDCTSFNQPLNLWDLSNVKTINAMFRGCTSFNQDISMWDVKQVRDFQAVFMGATLYNQDLGLWPISEAIQMTEMFQNSGMTCENYTDTVVGWANKVFADGGFPQGVTLTLQTAMIFATSRTGGAGFANAAAARTYLTDLFPGGASWSITGDTVQINC